MASPPTTPSRRRASPAKSSLSRRLTLVPSDCTPSPHVLPPPSPPSFPVAADRGMGMGGVADPWATPPAISSSSPSRHSNGRSSTPTGRRNTLTPNTTPTLSSTPTHRSSTPTPSKSSRNSVSLPLDSPLPFTVRLPPRPSDLPDCLDGASAPSSRETSPSRFSLASPLARIATVKHARTQSCDQAGATIFNMFKTPDTTPEKKGFFAQFSLSSPNSAPPQQRRVPQSTDIIDEFSGLNFPALMSSFLAEPTGTPQTPDEALRRSPEGRLEHVVSTATELLDRVYSAYRQRTAALTDALGELDLAKENASNEQLRTAHLKSQLSRLAEVERLAADEATLRAQAQARRITELEAELARERRKRDAIEDELAHAHDRRGKRASAGSASDSGFESDAESLDTRASAVVSPVAVEPSITEAVDDDDLILHFPGHDCDACRAREVQAQVQAQGPKNPTPLREAWGPDGAAGNGGNGGSGSGNGNGGVWGFFKGRQQQRTQRQSWNPEWDLDSVKQENRLLKSRIREMEMAVEGALEVVAGRGI
ncbi:hypothetical protein EDC01DRAFT_658283 [Geopyxis carbonaria]|nr:hypothetical protein EDC01DRAFT_658283 [Geopyxis carbonaria]